MNRSEDLVAKMLFDYQYSVLTMPELESKYNCTHKVFHRLAKEHGISNRRHKYIFNEDFFQVIDTEYKAYFLGFMLADGCVSDNNSINITCHEQDIDILHKFKQNIASNHKISSKQGGRIRCVEIQNQKMGNDLRSLGVIPRKSLVAVLPNIDKSLNKHLFRGLIDGDGSLGLSRLKYPIISLAGSLNIVTGFTDHCAEFLGRRNSIYNHGKIFMCRYFGEAAIKVMTNLYFDAKIYLDRKYEIYQKLCV